MDAIREENLLGNRKVIVGKATEDLVLETLGKVYIKSGRNFTLLNEIIDKITKLSDGINSGKVTSNSIVYIINNLKEIGTYPEGSLVFDNQTESLYIIINNSAILLVESKNSQNAGYVKKIGDIMSGQLIIEYQGGPPLTVASSQLVPNLNADKLDNYHVSELAIKSKNEKITGSWTHQGTTTFDNVTTFNSQAAFNNNIVQQGGGLFSNNYIGTKQFTPGFQGVGWCVQPDDTGYTLTVDNLVVRKAMEVFELIVNKINATNGSMWVSDYGKVYKSYKIQVLRTDSPTMVNTGWYVKYTDKAKQDGEYYEVEIQGEHLSNSLELKKDTVTYIVFNKVHFSPFLDKPNISIKSFDLLDDPITILGNITQNQVDSSNMLAKFRIAPESIVTSDGTLESNVKLINNKYIYSKDAEVWTYYRYFGLPKERLDDLGKKEVGWDSIIYLPGLHMVEFESEDCLPTLWEGDLVRCQKFSDNSIRYYDALIGKSITMSQQKLIESFNEKDEKVETIEESSTANNYILPIFTITGSTMGNTEVYYDEVNNTTTRTQVTVVYDKTTGKEEIPGESKANATKAIIEPIQQGDVIVRIGHVYNPRRQGAIYLTSSEQNSPYLNMIAEVNRPDYSVLYYTPKYKQFTALQKINPNDQNSNTSRYQDFYVQSSDFNALYKPDSDFYNLYQPYTIQQGLAESALDPRDDKVVDTPESKNIALTNSITDYTKFKGIIPASINKTSRLLYVSELKDEPYINITSYVDSRESTKYNGKSYYIGSL